MACLQLSERRSAGGTTVRQHALVSWKRLTAHCHSCRRQPGAVWQSAPTGLTGASPCASLCAWHENDHHQGPQRHTRWQSRLSNSGGFWQVQPQALLTALTTRAITAVGERIVKQLGPGAAAESRDSLAKNLYAKLFDWLVAAINRKISALGGLGRCPPVAVAGHVVWCLRAGTAADALILICLLVPDCLQLRPELVVRCWQACPARAEAWQGCCSLAAHGCCPAACVG